MSEDLKALTVINLPFIDKKFAPGSMVPRSDIDEYAEQAARQIPLNDEGDNVKSADDFIAEMIENGSLSDDPDAAIHPDHLPVDPGKPTILQMIEQARDLVGRLEERGEDVPSALRKLAETEYNHATSGDVAEGEVETR